MHALKVLHSGSPGLAARLLQEGRIQARIRHRNVLVVNDVIDIDGRPGLAMEYLAGGTLSDWLEGGERTLAEKLAIFRGVVNGVAAAHREGLVHRDLKPSNVLMETSEVPPVPKVADFGIAKVLGEAGGVHTRTGLAIGTLAYMAPEQARNAKAADARCDVYALACMLYELVCDRHPFPGDDLWPVMQAKMESSYVRVRAIVPGVPEAVELAIAYGLVPEPEGRLQDCEMLMGVLEGGIGAGLLRGRLGPCGVGGAARLPAASETIEAGGTQQSARPGVATISVVGRVGFPAPPSQRAVRERGSGEVPGTATSTFAAHVRSLLLGLSIGAAILMFFWLGFRAVFWLSYADRSLPEPAPLTGDDAGSPRQKVPVPSGVEAARCVMANPAAALGTERSDPQGGSPPSNRATGTAADQRSALAGHESTSVDGTDPPVESRPLPGWPPHADLLEPLVRYDPGAPSAAAKSVGPWDTVVVETASDLHVAMEHVVRESILAARSAAFLQAPTNAALLKAGHTLTVVFLARPPGLAFDGVQYLAENASLGRREFYRPFAQMDATLYDGYCTIMPIGNYMIRDSLTSADVRVACRRALVSDGYY